MPKDEISPELLASRQVAGLDENGRPIPGAIVNAGQSGAYKRPWTESDVRRQFPEIEWFNYGPLRSVTFNGVRIGFGGGTVRTPAIARDLAYQSYEAQGMGDDMVRRTGGSVTVGALEPRG